MMSTHGDGLSISSYHNQSVAHREGWIIREADTVQIDSTREKKPPTPRVIRLKKEATRCLLSVLLPVV